MSQQPVVHPSPCPSLGDVQKFNTLFFDGNNPPTCPNTDLCCNSLALCPPGLPKASSPLIRDAWDLLLANYPDCEFISGLLNIVDVGASIGHLGPLMSQSCKNLRSAIDHMTLYLRKYIPCDWRDKYMDPSQSCHCLTSTAHHLGCCLTNEAKNDKYSIIINGLKSAQSTPKYQTQKGIYTMTHLHLWWMC